MNELLSLCGTGELLLSDAGGLLTFTIATWHDDYVMLQRMYLDPRNGWWERVIGRKYCWNDHKISPSDPILKLFGPSSENPIDVGSATRVSICPAVVGNGNDWAVWTEERVAEEDKRIQRIMSYEPKRKRSGVSA